MGITIHDFKMTGIRLDPVSGVTVSLFDDSVQGSYDLVFGRVRKASIDGFSSQNVVLDLKVFHRDALNLGSIGLDVLRSALDRM